jgi:hypothetical protein
VIDAFKQETDNNIVKDFRNLVRIGYPLATGERLWRILLHYLYLARSSFFKRKKAKTETHEVGSRSWNCFRYFLKFTTDYIPPKNWARTPLIRDVTLVHIHELPSNVEYSDVQVEFAKEISYLAQRYSRAFAGYTEKEFQNWLTRYVVLLQTFKDQGVNPILTKSTLLEIGSGLGAALTLCAEKPGRKVVALDLVEMKPIQMYVSKEVMRYPLQFEFRTSHEFHNNVRTIEIPYFVVAFWSLTEIALDERSQYESLISKAEFSLIASNEEFDSVQNFAYLDDLSRKLKKVITYKTVGEIYGSDLPNYAQKHRVYLLR